MDLQKDKYIIVEIVPTHSNPEKGFIAQLSALKLEGTKLLDRFDYRVNEDLILNEDILNIIFYDKDKFNYVDNKEDILNKFREWIEDYPLVLLDSTYTLSYLDSISNSKELVYPYLGLDYTFDVFSKLVDKYKLEPSNYLVDLVYEAIIYEGNKK